MTSEILEQSSKKEIKTKKSNILFLLPGMCLSALIFRLDISLPLGVAGAMPYIMVVLLGVWLPTRGCVIVLAIIGTLLTVLGYFLSPQGSEMWVVLMNRGLSVVVIWVAALLVTSRKKAEDELRQAHNLLEQKVLERTAVLENVIVENTQVSERYLRLFQILAQNPNMIMLTDEQGVIEYVNQSFVDLIGLRTIEIIGKKPWVLTNRLAVSKIQSDFFATFKQSLETGDVSVHEIMGERLDGSLLCVLETVVPIKSVDGVLTHYAAMYHDISEQKKVESLLRQSQKMDVIDQLSGGIAHDFNNILGIITGNLDMLDLVLDEDDKNRIYVEIGLQGARRGAKLTEKILGLSSNTLMVAKPVNLNTILQDMEELLIRSLPTETKIELILDPDLQAVKIVQGDFEDSLINLVINARDAMPDGGTICLSTQNVKLAASSNVWTADGEILTGDYIRLTVRDTGFGIPLNIKDKIFEPFFTTKSNGKGTGLGLSMVNGWVTRSEGHISVSSNESIGTTFDIYIPQSKENVTQEDAPQFLSKKIVGGSETILVVDDEFDLVALSERGLRNLGYKVLTAHNAEEALNILDEEQNIDVLFSDVEMPGSMNGLELAEKVKNENPTVRILMTTGHIKNIEKYQDQYSLLKGRLDKPYRQADLARSIRALID